MREGGEKWRREEGREKGGREEDGIQINLDRFC